MKFNSSSGKLILYLGIKIFKIILIYISFNWPFQHRAPNYISTADQYTFGLQQITSTQMPATLYLLNKST